MPLPVRLAVLITLVVLSAVVITAALNYAKFTQVTETLDGTRYAFLAGDLKATLEASLNLGLPLDQIENAQEIVDRQRARYPELLAIEVFDETGTVLYASARARPDLMDALSERAAVSVPLDGDRIAATRLVNPFGATVGGVSIRVSSADAARRDQTMLASLGTAVLSAAAVGTAAVAAMAALLLNGVRRRLQMQEHIIASLSAPNAEAKSGFEAGGFEAAASHAFAELAEVERLLEKSEPPRG